MQKPPVFSLSMANDTQNSMKMQTADSKHQTNIPITDAILEIQEIEYEQRLIREQIYRINIEKQRLQQLLNILQSSKCNSKKTNPKEHYYSIQSTDSDSEYDSSD